MANSKKMELFSKKLKLTKMEKYQRMLNSKENIKPKTSIKFIKTGKAINAFKNKSKISKRAQKIQKAQSTGVYNIYTEKSIRGL